MNKRAIYIYQKNISSKYELKDPENLKITQTKRTHIIFIFILLRKS